MSLEANYSELKETLSTFKEDELYLLLANYLFDKVKDKSNTDKTDKRFKYLFDDLLDYNYLKEYLDSDPDNSTLILAKIAHILLSIGGSSDN